MQYIKPYSDELMTYDFTTHKYYLTENAVYVELGINFGLIPNGNDANPSTMAQRFIKKVTNNVYRYLFADIYNAPWTEFELACVADLRSVIYQMLLAQAEYNANSGFSETFNGVDIYKGYSLDRSKLKEAQISPVVEELSFQGQRSIGRCLKYAGAYGGTPPSYIDETGNPVY